jgi:polysaccharide export outer membrane protein
LPTLPAAQPHAEKQEPAGGAQSITIQLKDLLETGDSAYNILVFGGDVISVPRAGIIYVAGAVLQPGGYVLQTAGDQITTLKAIALAHGLTSTSKAGQAVILRNDPNGGQKQEINVDLNKIMQRKTDDVRLYANDVLFVPDSKAKRVLYRGGEALLAGSTYLLYRIP